jgi:calcineurin-like phosphoesterase family protein
LNRYLKRSLKLQESHLHKRDMKIFFTSDTFFGRKLSSAERGFSSVEEMDDVLIENWNSKVGSNDLVYHLGNFAWDPISAESSIIHLNGRIHFIGGSYDQHMSEVSLIKSNRHFLLPSISYLPKEHIVLTHWPLLDWPEKKKGSLHIHGGLIKSNIQDGYRFNASVDNWSLSPVDMDSLKDIIDSHKNQS